MSLHSKPNPRLVLGWRVTKGLDPEYWLSPKPEPGDPEQHKYLITVPARSIAHHTVIVAQSGAGKSFFLGRIIEEIILNTRSRVFVFDPNSDFRKVSTTNRKIWEKPSYNATTRSGFLPHEQSPDEFEGRWNKVTKAIHTSRPAKDTTHHKLQIDWLGISMELFSDGLPATSQNELRHCHEFVRSIANLVLLTRPKGTALSRDPLDAAAQIFRDTKGFDHSKTVAQIETSFPVNDNLIANIPKSISQSELQKAGIFFSLIPFLLSKIWPDKFSADINRAITDRIKALHNSAALDRIYVQEEMERFYFSTAYILKSSGLLGDRASQSSSLSDARLQVIDLPSISSPRLRLLAVSALLETEWARARRNWELALESPNDDIRVPTFIVVDEAHNLISAETVNPPQKALLEQFRRIAAEGRKFGLFLILISQRPDKLDPLVLSECENRAVMKVGSEAVLKITADALGLGDVSARTLSRCLEFDIGRALLIGPWTGDRERAVFLYGAARRTAEGGKNLKEDHWARPPSTRKNTTRGRHRNAERRKSIKKTKR